MDTQTTDFLLNLNLRFYRQFGKAFAETRRRIQPGVRQVLQLIPSLNPAPDGGNWLDMGCGSGALAAAWKKCCLGGTYTGIDFSPELLEEAQTLLNETPAPYDPHWQTVFRFLQRDLCAPDWAEPFQGQVFDGILSFAVLHHLPGAALRQSILKQARALLPTGGWFIHSVWQFHLSPRLAARSLPWKTVGIDEKLLEEGDTLLDWRHALPDQTGQVGLRYVHRFSLDELEGLAHAAHFTIVNTFESDGKEGKLGLYQQWQAI